MIIKAVKADFERTISCITTLNPEGGRVAFCFASSLVAFFVAFSFLSAIFSLLPIEF